MPIERKTSPQRGLPVISRILPPPPPERAPSPPPPPSAPHPPPRRRPPTPPPRRAAHVTRHPSGAGTSRPVPHITPKHPECDLLRTPRVQSGDRHLAGRRGSTSARRDLRRRGADVAVGGGGAALQPLHRMPREERPDADPTNRRSAAIRSTRRRTLNGEGAVRRPPRLVRLVRLPFPPLIAPLFLGSHQSTDFFHPPDPAAPPLVVCARVDRDQVFTPLTRSPIPEPRS